MRCPKDSTICKRKQLEEVEIDVCPTCQGVWLEKSEVRNLTKHFSMPNYSNVDELLKAWEVVENESINAKEFWSEDKLVCLKDNTQMLKHHFAGSNVGVDQCPSCLGFWLDGGELQAVAKYMEPNPDLDKAWGSFIRDEIEWREKLADMSALPAKLSAYSILLASPSVMVAVVGSFVIKMITERLIIDNIWIR